MHLPAGPAGSLQAPGLTVALLCAGRLHRLISDWWQPCSREAVHTIQGRELQPGTCVWSQTVSLTPGSPCAPGAHLLSRRASQCKALSDERKNPQQVKQGTSNIRTINNKKRVTSTPRCARRIETFTHEELFHAYSQWSKVDTTLGYLDAQSMPYPQNGLLLCHRKGCITSQRLYLVKEGSASPVVSGRESTCQCRRCRFDPWARKIPCRREWQPTPVFLPGEFHEQRSVVGCSLWGHKESDKTEELTHTHYRGVWGFQAQVSHSPCIGTFTRKLHFTTTECQ